MTKTSSLVGIYGESAGPITRSRAAASRTSCPVILKPHVDKKQEVQQKQGGKSKVSLVGDKSNAKRKAPFMDITNVSHQDIIKRSMLPGTSLQKPASRTNRTATKKMASLAENAYPVPATKPFTSKRKAAFKDVTNRTATKKMASLAENAYPVPATKPFTSKRKAAFKDVTDAAIKNVTSFCREAFFEDFIYAATRQPKRLQKNKIGLSKSNPALTTRDKTSIEEDTKDKLNAFIVISKGNVVPREISVTKDELFQERKEHANNIYSRLKDEDNRQESRKELSYIDIDLDHTNPQMCTEYAVDIYYSLRVHELDRRPITNFMETIQRDITQSMRSILIDWLVEVAEEYKLVPDTLHLTVHIIDQFLSHNYIERQSLQLLGITCMLIASKFEEICAPRVDEFCFITDNTYTAEDVKKMERQVVNSLNFRLSVPTAKTFLRRFLRAAQASYKVSTLVLEYLANYLVELTLIEYSFLKFIPSNVAASAVFLARWTIDQSSHPWNYTLEHYTCYKAPDLKAAVFAMHDLQKNSKNCPLHAIREKYRQLKFKSVANLPPQEPLPSLFSDTCTPSLPLTGKSL